MDRGVCGASGFEGWQLPGLLRGVGALALPASPPRAALFHGTVVEHATAQQDHSQRLFLLGRWQQLVLVGRASCVDALLVHTDTVCLIGG